MQWEDMTTEVDERSCVTGRGQNPAKWLLIKCVLHRCCTVARGAAAAVCRLRTLVGRRHRRCMLLWMFSSLARFSDVVNFRLAGCWTCVRSTIGGLGGLGRTYAALRHP